MRPDSRQHILKLTSIGSPSFESHKDIKFMSCWNGGVGIQGKIERNSEPDTSKSSTIDLQHQVVMNSLTPRFLRQFPCPFFRDSKSADGIRHITKRVPTGCASYTCNSCCQNGQQVPVCVRDLISITIAVL